MANKHYMCPDCKKGFNTIVDVNRHIKKTNCNEKISVTIEDYFSDRQIDEINRQTYDLFKARA